MTKTQGISRAPFQKLLAMHDWSAGLWTASWDPWHCRMGSMEGAPWDASIQQLLQDGIITGYALLSKAGKAEAAAGVLSTAERRSGDAAPAQPPSMQMHHFVEAFSHSSAPPSAFRLAGQSAVVFRRTDCDILAISHRRRLGLCIHALPFGILVCTYSRARLPQEVVPRVLKVCDLLRS